MSRARAQFEALNARLTPRVHLPPRAALALVVFEVLWLGGAVTAMVLGYLHGFAAFAVMVLGLITPMIVLKAMKNQPPAPTPSQPATAPPAPSQDDDGSPFVK